MGDEGLELVTFSPRNKPIGRLGAAESGAQPEDPELKLLTRNWERLPASVRKSIAAIVDAHLADARCTETQRRQQ